MRSDSIQAALAGRAAGIAAGWYYIFHRKGRKDRQELGIGNYTQAPSLLALSSLLFHRKVRKERKEELKIGD